jgi:hypothetical protein
MMHCKNSINILPNLLLNDVGAGIYKTESAIKTGLKVSQHLKSAAESRYKKEPKCERHHCC